MKVRVALHFTLFSLLIFGSATINCVAQETSIPPIMQIEKSTASALAWSPDGKFLAIGDTEGVSIYTRELEFIRLLELPTKQMKTLAWSPNGSLIAAGGGNDIGTFDPDEPRQKAIYIWDTINWELLTRYDEHEGYVPSIAWSPDGSLIASGSWDRTIRIWDPLNGATYFILPAPLIEHETNEIFSLDWSRRGHIAATVGNQHLFIWESFQKKPEYLNATSGAVTWSPNGDRLTLGSGYISMSDRVAHRLENCTLSGFTDWSPNGRWYATLTWYSGIEVCDPSEDHIVMRLDAWPSLDALFGYQDAVDWHPDGNLIAGASGGGFVGIWDVSALVGE